MNGGVSVFRLFSLICLILLLEACKKDDDGPAASITAAETSVQVPASAGNYEIAIEASGTEWTVTEAIDWLEAVKVDNETLRVSHDENPDTKERSGTVTAAISGQSVEVTVTQEADKRPAFASDAAIADQTYTQKMEITALTLPQAIGGDGALTYTLSPNLAMGLTFNAAQRTITGTPESSLPQTEFTYTVTDEDGDTDELTFMMTINETLMPAFANDAVIANQTYTQNVEIPALALPQATGGDGALTYTLSPNLAMGLTFNATQRTITGAPEAVLTTTEYTYTATDADGDAAALTFMLTVEADVAPAFANDASVVPQIYTEGKAIADLTLPQAKGGNGHLTYTLTKSDGTPLPDGLAFDETMRVLAGTPQAGTAAAAANYTLTVGDTDSDTDDLIFSITIRAADATPLALTPAGTLSVVGNSTTNNTLRLTSSVAWEAVEAEDWITAVTPPTGTAALAATIALTYEGNGAFEPRTGSVTFKETTAGASPPFDTTLTVTQTAGSSLSTTMYEVPARADAAANVTLDVTLGPGVTHWWITAADGGFASTVTGVRSVSANAGTRAMRNATAFTLNVEENPEVTGRDFELRLHVGEATGEALSSVPFTVTQAPRPVTLGTTVYEIGVQSATQTIMFTGLAFTKDTGVTHWWITAADGRFASTVAGVTSVTVNASARAETSVMAFDMNVEVNDVMSRDLPLRLNVGKTTGDVLFSVPFTIRQRGRVTDGMIPINNLEQLNAIRYDLTGDGLVDHAGDKTDMTAAGTAYAVAFPNVVHASGRYTGYRLMRNLNFSNAGSYASGEVNTDWTEAGSGEGWLPVGPDASNRFSGTFDGSGHAIDSLFINRTDDDLSLGLFGYVKGTISDTGIRIAKVTGGLRALVGGLVGSNSGTISGCYVSGGTTTGGNNCSIGGLIGTHTGGIISGCYVSGGTTTGGNASSPSGGAGGLLGASISAVSACYVKNRTVSVSSGTYVGSLIGVQLLGTITACYAGGRTYTNLRGAGSGTINYSYYEAASEPTAGDDAKATVTAKTKDALRKPTAYGTGIFADWDNIDLNANGTKDTEDTNDFWDFGENDEYPVLKGIDVNGDGMINAADLAAQR